MKRRDLIKNISFLALCNSYPELQALHSNNNLTYFFQISEENKIFVSVHKKEKNQIHFNLNSNQPDEIVVLEINQILNHSDFVYLENDVPILLHNHFQELENHILLLRNTNQKTMLFLLQFIPENFSFSFLASYECENKDSEKTFPWRSDHPIHGILTEQLEDYLFLFLCSNPQNNSLYFFGYHSIDKTFVTVYETEPNIYLHNRDHKLLFLEKPVFQKTKNTFSILQHGEGLFFYEFYF